MNTGGNRLATLDATLVETAKSIRILSSLTWPRELVESFLSGWRAGSPKLPVYRWEGRRCEAAISALEALSSRCDRQHPLERYIAETAGSYLTAAHMLAGLGSPTFTEHSARLYGVPDTRLGPRGPTVLEAADLFIESTEDFIAASPRPADACCVLPSHVAGELQRVIAGFFTDHPVEVVIDDELASRAAAGSRRVRIRGSTSFSWNDIPQLLHHEVFVHTLTMLNGREQPVLKSMGLGAPRTTLTQEGLAIFAEFITNSIDLHRLRRIALRIKAVEFALEGADFLDLFRFFLENGQSEQESFLSAMRIFRGGDLRGRVCFTKDVVYLKGFVLIHTFLLKAIQGGKATWPHILFSGRLALADLPGFEEYYGTTVAPPRYEPGWIRNRDTLLAFLLHSGFTNRIALDEIELDDLTVA